MSCYRFTIDHYCSPFDLTSRQLLAAVHNRSAIVLDRRRLMIVSKTDNSIALICILNSKNKAFKKIVSILKQKKMLITFDEITNSIQITVLCLNCFHLLK